MAKLGTNKHPIVVRVREPARAEEIMKICHEHGWQVIVGIEPDKSEDITDLEKMLNPPEPIVTAHLKIGRNDPCLCGSGKKYKKCCLLEESA
jgi:SWIM/SEC-C metal-binding protein